MTAVTINTPVLVVGGGPVGLSLAIDLAWRGIGCTLVERGLPEERVAYPRMDNVGIRTMELARRWGIVESIEHAGFPRDLPMSIVYTTAVLGPELDRDVRPDKATQPCPPFSPQKHELCPQNFFDPAMQRAAAAYPGNRMLYGHALETIEQHADHVEALLCRLSDGTKCVVRAQYVAGCDGAASTVASSLGLAPSESKVLACSTNIFIASPALARATAAHRAYRYILADSCGIWGSMVNIDGRDGWRLQVLGDENWPNWTDDDIARFVRKAIGSDVPYELQSVVPWARRELVVDRYRSGRCFLIGDSAHQFSPTGGYGMNTGIAEAADLSWKLAACIEGWGGDALLDSYEAERRPVAVANARQASENLAAMRAVRSEPRLLEAGTDGDAIRAHLGKEIRSAMYREWHSYGIHLGSTYHDSPIVVSERRSGTAPDVTRFVQSAEPGARAPHIWLEPGRSTLDLFGNGFMLLELATAPLVAPDHNALIVAARERGVPIRHQLISDIQARALYGSRFVLVRPDGYVAWRGEAVPAQAGALIDLVRGVASTAAKLAKEPLADKECAMINIQPSPERLRELKAASADLPGPWISEIVLQTNQYNLMKLWYEAILGGDWIAETNPNGAPPQEDRAGVGGKQVFASDVRACFMRVPMPHPYTMTFALFELTRLAHAPDDDPGLNHMQLKFPDLDALIQRLEILREYALHPHRGANHGATTSFYFRDPDENIVELCVDNFATVAEKVAFMQSPVFRANPSGISLDRDSFVAEHRADARRHHPVVS